MTDETRSAAQNRKMWAGLHDIASQVAWPQFEADGQIRVGRMDAESWKCVLTAGLSKSQRMAQGIDGGWVMLGQSTSKMQKRRFAELLDLAQHFGDSKGVNWSDPEWLAMVAEHRVWLAREEARASRKMGEARAAA